MTTTEPPPLSSTRSTTVLVVVLRLIALTALGYAVARPIQSASSRLLRLTTTVGDDADVRLSVPGLPAGTRAHLVDHAVSLSLTGQGAGPKLLEALPDVLGGIGVAVGALLLAALVRDLGRGEVFTARSVRCTNLLAATVLLTGLLVPIADDVLTTLLLDRNGLLEPGLPFAPGIHLSYVPVVLAVLLSMLATTWQSGARMRADLEGLV